MKIFASVLLCLMFLYGCKKPDNFEYRDLKNFKIDSLGKERSTVSLDVIAYNPNNYGMDLRNINCDVYIEHNYMGKYLLDTNMHIPKKSEFVIPSRMQVNMKNLGKTVAISVFSNELLLEVKGTARVGKAGIFMTFPFEYSGKHNFGLF